MRTLILLYLGFLGLFSSQVSAAARSYTTHYAELVLESSVLDSITEELASVASKNVTVAKQAAIEYVNITTECSTDNDETNCTCKENYIWSNAVCRSHPECCTTEYCITISGFVTLLKKYEPDLANSSTELFQRESAEISKILKSVLSELSGFDNLVITQFRSGSIIAEFIVDVNTAFDSQVLSEKRDRLEEQLKDLFLFKDDLFMETKGLVTMTMPNMPVCSGCEAEMSCTFVESADVYWKLTRNEKTVNITNGTMVTIVAKYGESQLKLKKASAVWKGSYECIFLVDSIKHKASSELDIALLPETVNTHLDPQFQDCIGTKHEFQTSIIKYEIKNDSENYVVQDHDEKDIIPAISSDTITYKVTTTINCTDKEDPVVQILFKNRLNQTLLIDTTIPVIYNPPYCPEDMGWPKAKRGFKATLSCSDSSVGKRERKCDDFGSWEDEISYCVYNELNTLLEDALSIQEGRGSVQYNSEDVFKRMKEATSTTKDINTYANVNASVKILSVMSTASNASIENQPQQKPLTFETLHDVLHSASNLLNQSLNTSWIPTSNETDNNLSATYLQAVEGLSQNTKISNHAVLNYPNVDFFSCPPTDCNKQVLNASVSIIGGNSAKGILRTIGFKHLSGLLPNEKKDTEPATIIVSATFENENPNQESNGISLKFLLNKKIPRNHKAYCVFWDFFLQTWSKNGCELKKTKGKNGEEQAVCECSHLTPFSVLMSKSPVDLIFLDELTCIALGVSIGSLAIFLTVELIIWNSAVKTSIAHFRHTALINISLCLLLADCCFLASDSKLLKTHTGNVCLILVLLKHFFYLAMFFWMLCLSIMLLHKLTFVFHQVRKTVYLTLSIAIGYGCPAVIVLFSYVFYNNGELDSYYNKECWLKYDGVLRGSIHAFILPAGMVVFINIFSLAVVISKLLQPSLSEGYTGDEKDMAKSILKAVVFFTPTFGITWILGFFTLALDLGDEDDVLPRIVHYLFTVLNGFQGMFILLIGFVGEPKARKALLVSLNAKFFPSKSTTSETSTRTTDSKK